MTYEVWVGLWMLSIIGGFIAGSLKDRAWLGAGLCLFLGPLGLLACFAIPPTAETLAKREAGLEAMRERRRAREGTQ